METINIEVKLPEGVSAKDFYDACAQAIGYQETITRKDGGERIREANPVSIEQTVQAEVKKQLNRMYKQGGGRLAALRAGNAFTANAKDIE